MEAMKNASVAVGALVAILLVGCGSKGPATTPDACLEPVGGWLEALDAAPDTVRLEGETPIGDCFTGSEDPGVGQTAIRAASLLNARARRDPGGPFAVRLGYLAGAVHEGTSHVPSEADLVRRLDTSARYSPGGGSLGAGFERAFGKGYAAGEATG